MNHRIDLQNASKIKPIPSRKQFQQWVNAALSERLTKAELTIRLVDEEESTTLNQTYRHKKGPTNILSFPFTAPPPITLPLLGDLVICVPLVIQEARQQGKTVESHWAHLVIHGTLHLLGYDHAEEKAAEVMEGIEIKILASLGFNNPYESD